MTLVSLVVQFARMFAMRKANRVNALPTMQAPR